VNHVVVGALLPLLVCVAIYVRAGGRAGPRLLVLGPLAMLISGGWAIVPDLPRLAGQMERYVAWHHTSYCDVFWGHCWIDRHPALEDWPYYPVVAMVLGALVFAAAWRELRKLERF
jgi:hypothetical protein